MFNGIIKHTGKLRNIIKGKNYAVIEILSAMKPILEEVSNEKGITIILEKASIMLNAEKMDITNEVLKKLNKSLPTINLSRD